LLEGLLPLVVLAAATHAAAAQPPDPPPMAAPALPAAPLTLRDCLALAAQHQPKLAAARASLACAEVQLAGLDALHLPAAMANPDLGVRRKQAQLGVEIARIALASAETETVYEVTRTFYSVLYARAQLQLAREAARDLTLYRQVIEKLAAKEANPDRKTWTELGGDLVAIYLREVEDRGVEAEAGEELGVAALREAMGLAPCACLTIAGEALPEPRVAVCREDFIAMALARNAYLAEAALTGEVVHLEVDAQGHISRPGSIRTFAASADIHAEPVPLGRHGTDYRPGAVPVEMPAYLSGYRTTRVQAAQHLDARAEAVVQKTRGLILLEAEGAYLAWRSAARKVELRRSAARAGERIRKKLFSDDKTEVENLLPHALLAIQVQVDYNESVFQLLLALADLQRVTNGGFDAGLAGGCGNR